MKKVVKRRQWVHTFTRGLATRGLAAERDRERVKGADSVGEETIVTVGHKI